MTRLGCIAVAFVLLAAGCGSTKPHAPKAAPRPGSATLTAIRSRLTKAGYTVTESTGSELDSPAFVPPRGELDSFYVEVDFTSPNSFKFDVIVFQTHADVERWLTSIRVERAKSLKRCRSDPRCRALLKVRGAAPALPLQRVVGPADYSAATDSPEAKLPLAKFEQLVALAAGRA